MVSCATTLLFYFQTSHQINVTYDILPFEDLLPTTSEVQTSRQGPDKEEAPCVDADDSLLGHNVVAHTQKREHKMSPAKEASMSSDQDFDPDLSARWRRDDSDSTFNIDEMSLKIAEIDVSIEKGVAKKASGYNRSAQRTKESECTNVKWIKWTK